MQSTPSGASLLGETQSPAAFTSIDWADFYQSQGLIAGGLADGRVTLWDPSVIANQGPRPCVSVQNIHDGVAVTAIEFNSLK